MRLKTIDRIISLSGCIIGRAFRIDIHRAAFYNVKPKTEFIDRFIVSWLLKSRREQVNHKQCKPFEADDEPKGIPFSDENENKQTARSEFSKGHTHTHTNVK